MYDPTLGRWIAEDPTGFQAADANLYRYVGNAPVTNVDQTGEQASSITWVNRKTLPATFEQRLVGLQLEKKKGTEAGYLFGVDISWKGATYPKEGYFVQLNTIENLIVTDDGRVHIDTRYVVDHNPAAAGLYEDTLQGPDFDSKLTPNVVFAFSRVTKRQGFSSKMPVYKQNDPFKSGEVFTDPAKAAAAENQMMGKPISQDLFEYSYLFVNAANYNKAFKNQKIAQALAVIEARRAVAVVTPLTLSPMAGTASRLVESVRATMELRDPRGLFSEFRRVLGFFLGHRKDFLEKQASAHALYSNVRGIFGPGAVTDPPARFLLIISGDFK